MKLFKQPCIAFMLFKSLSLYAFEPTSLIIPNETWEGIIPEDEKSSFRTVISYVGSKFYDEDLKNKRFQNPENDGAILSGVMVIDNTINPNIAKDCALPRVVPVHIEGGIYTRKDKKIVLWSKDELPYFNFSAKFLRRIRFLEITNIRGNEADGYFSGAVFSFSDSPFAAKRIGPFKLKKIN